MKRGIWIGLVAALAFIAILIARLPASWLAGYLPRNVTCAEIAGTLWNGSCTGLAAQGRPMGDLNWQLRAAPLLTGKASGHVEIQHPAGTATADVEASSGGDLEARGVVADFAIDPALLPQVPPNIRGRVHANLARLRLEKEAVTALEGRIDLNDLENRSASEPAIGSYTLSFPARRAQAAPGEIVGDADSVSGPWEFTGTLSINRERSVIDGLIAPGPGAPLDAVKDLGSLGPADAQGRRHLTIENSFR